MALLVAVVALDNGALGLDLFLGAVLGSVSELLTVVALGLANPGDNITGIGKSLQHLIMVLGPTLSFRLTQRLVGEAVIDGVLLTQIALKVHVGKGNGQVGTLLGDEVKTIALGAERLLDLNEGGLWLSLGVDLNLLFDLIQVLLDDGLLKELPGLLASHIRNVAAVDLAGIGALSGEVLCQVALVKRDDANKVLIRWREKLTSLTAVPAGGNVSRAVLCHVLTLAVMALHRLGAILEHVSGRAAGADQRHGAVRDEVSLLAAVAAAHGRLVRAVFCHVSLLLAVPALAGEGRGVGAVSLVVSARKCQLIVYLSLCSLGKVVRNVPSLATVVAGIVSTTSAAISITIAVVIAVAVAVVERGSTTVELVGHIVVARLPRRGDSGIATATSTVIPRHVDFEMGQKACGLIKSAMGFRSLATSSGKHQIVWRG